jgi:hypothetical protein
MGKVTLRAVDMYECKSVTTARFPLNRNTTCFKDGCTPWRVSITTAYLRGSRDTRTCVQALRMTVFDKTRHGMYGTVWLSTPSVSVGYFTLQVKAELLSHQHHDPSSSNKDNQSKKRYGWGCDARPRAQKSPGSSSSHAYSDVVAINSNKATGIIVWCTS